MESAGSSHREDHFHGAESATSTTGLAHRIPGGVAEVLAQRDLSQIEMVLIAVVTGDRNLIELLQSGRDVYVEYGARIFGKKLERGPGDDQITDRLRSVAKVPTLGISYGLTPSGFVRQVQNELGTNTRSRRPRGFSKRSSRCSLRSPLIKPGRLRMPSVWTVFTLSEEPGAGSRFWRIARATTGRHSNGARRS